MGKHTRDTTVVRSNILEALRSQKDSTLIAWTIIIEFSFVLAVVAYWSEVLGWQVDLRPVDVIFKVLIAFVFFTVGMSIGNRKNEERRAFRDEVMGRFDKLDTNQKEVMSRLDGLEDKLDTNQKEVMSRFNELEAKLDTNQNEPAVGQTTLDGIKAILLRIKKYLTSGRG